jgi:D-glycero-D-manno-heptose 1,7-bisphosphate phosphatase
VPTELNRFRGTAFLDRDGTINAKAPQGDYVKTVEEFALLPNAAEAIRAINEAGFRVIVVTNQRGIALGRMSEQDLRLIHQHMLEQLKARGATVDGIYHCPHGRGSCRCRKPEVGIFLRAAREHLGLKLHESVIFGDSESDMAAGCRLRMTRVLVGGEFVDEPRHPEQSPTFHHRAPSLIDGVSWFLARDPQALKRADAELQALV